MLAVAMSGAASWNTVLWLDLTPGTPETKLDAFSCNSSHGAAIEAFLTKHHSKSRVECFFQSVFNLVSWSSCLTAGHWEVGLQAKHV